MREQLAATAYGVPDKSVGRTTAKAKATASGKGNGNGKQHRALVSALTTAAALAGLVFVSLKLC